MKRYEEAMEAMQKLWKSYEKAIEKIWQSYGKAMESYETYEKL